MPEIIPHSGLTLLDAFRAARDAGMHLIDNGLGDVRVSPIIPPGWREIPIKVKVTAPNRGQVIIAERVAA
jgi:hypothetical protein